MQGYCTLFLFMLIVLFTGIHKIEEGHVGIYYREGQLQKTIVQPGYHAMIPFLTRVQSIQVNVQTDLVRNIPCGTSGGVVIRFEQIQVVNRLRKEFVYSTIQDYTANYDKIWIYDKIHHEINQFCSQHSLQEIYIDLFDQLDEALISALKADLEKWVPGLEILAVRITKPVIPEIVRTNFQNVENQRSKYLLALQVRNLKVQQAETNQKQKLIQGNSELQVAQIQVERSIEDVQNQLEIAQIQNQMFMAREKAKVDSEYFANLQVIETSQKQLNEEYMQNEILQALTSDLTLFLGDSIPEYFGAQETFQKVN